MRFGNDRQLVLQVFDSLSQSRIGGGYRRSGWCLFNFCCFCPIGRKLRLHGFQRLSICGGFSDGCIGTILGGPTLPLPSVGLSFLQHQRCFKIHPPSLEGLQLEAGCGGFRLTGGAPRFSLSESRLNLGKTGAFFILTGQELRD